MVCRTIKGVSHKVWDSWEAATKNDPHKTSVDKFYDEAIEVGLGIADTGSAILHFPEDVVKYITGTDEYLGQRRSWRHFGESISWKSNPIIRTADTTVSMVCGAFDLLLGHIPHYIFNEKLGLNIPYFSPLPKTTRELAPGISRWLYSC